MHRPPTPAATQARMEHLVRTTTLSMHAIVRECEVHVSTVSLHAARGGWSRPEGAPRTRRSAPGARAKIPAASGPVDIATLVAECLGQLKGQLSELRRGHARGGGRTLTATFRAVTETTRTLKELARAAATLAPPAASAREPFDDDMDDARLDAICDELAEGYARWRVRRLPALPAGEPGALPDP